MAAGSAGLHEPEERLDPETIDRHRALVSIMEELEAVDWYAQRVDATSDPELAAVLAHNRDEEKEHAAMTIEWLRRHDSQLDRHLRPPKPNRTGNQQERDGGDSKNAALHVACSDPVQRVDPSHEFR